MEQSVLEMTKDLVKAQIEAGHLGPDDAQQALADTHAHLMNLQAKGDDVKAGERVVRGAPAGGLTWRKSITRHTITCLECGAVYKQLSIRHLSTHDLNARLYRQKYGIPQKQPLAGRETTARRRQVVQVIRPWEKTPRYLETQAAKKTAAKKRRS